ncbi:MAG: FkbM family methyltransferase [Litoreibacter sp.]
MNADNSLDPRLIDAEEKLKKLVRRQERNQRAAFAKGLMQGICSMLKPGDLVLDCGANVGAVTEVLAVTGADIHAFEPDPYAFAQLTKSSKKFKNVILHNVAVGTEVGTVHLMRANNFNDNPRAQSVKSSVVKGGRGIDEADSEMIEVRQISLLNRIKDLIETHGEIAFLKMDIEGAELGILEEMLKQDLFANIRLTVAETHERKFKNLRPRFAALRNTITDTYPITKVNLDWI